MLQVNDKVQLGNHLNTQQASLALPAEPASVAVGRMFIRTTLMGWGLEALCEEVVLVGSELITNALLHTDSPPRVSLSLIAGSHLRLEIEDESTIRPRRRPYTSDATTGRGMVLVESMVSRWGVHPRRDGKTVWCEFDT